ncbi:pyridoxamine 5'-phosphate oxidase family protein [Streptomyces prunicolor]|uniref:helix-turn-helix domain-containing protein n=1 Tax=Streptomyces prunicolor TaxID=67348 RepID=UPI0038704270|nr:pyridoxamine 5'-phosphate oxidase family protein [Streptomyces prunicolor]
MPDSFPLNVAEGSPTGDLGRRIAVRRTALDLSREETAAQAGVAASYLQYLEEFPGSAPGRGVLLRLAEVLHTTVTDLAGGDSDLTPGAGRAGSDPAFTELTVQECRELLSTHGVGRIAIPTVSGPVIVPVNYSVVDGAIVYRTAPGAMPSRAAGCQVTFEIDRIDEAFAEGWSVLALGRARTVTDPDDVRRLTEHAFSTPWAGGPREEWIRIDTLSLTGRRITTRQGTLSDVSGTDGPSPADPAGRNME